MAFKTKYPELLAYAQKKYKNVGAIISMYTLQAMWSDPEISNSLGYTQEEVQDMKLSKSIIWDSKFISRSFMEFFFRKGKQGAPTRAKDGRVVYVGGQAGGFIFKGEPYLVGYNMYIRPVKELTPQN